MHKEVVPREKKGERILLRVPFQLFIVAFHGQFGHRHRCFLGCAGRAEAVELSSEERSQELQQRGEEPRAPAVRPDGQT